MNICKFRILNKYVIIISIIVLFVIFIPLAVVTIPKAKDKNETLDPDIQTYIKGIYGKKQDMAFTDSFNRYLTFFFYNFPVHERSAYKIASNLSFKSPPTMFQRFQMTAFPWAKKGATILDAIKTLMWNQYDQATFPGWYINRYDYKDPNAYRHQYKTLFRPNTCIEVTHACYPPPGEEFPICDDGGWWLYMTPGTGVFWNTGDCLIGNNKLDVTHLLLMLENYRTSPHFQEKTFEDIKLKSTREEIEAFLKDNGVDVDRARDDAFNDMTNQIKHLGGGDLLVTPVFKIARQIRKTGKNTFTPEVLGWKVLSKRNGTASYQAWIFFSILYLVIFALMAMDVCIQIGCLFKKDYVNPYLQYSIGKKILYAGGWVALVVAMIFIYMYGILEMLFRGFGFVTMDMAKHKMGVSTYKEVVISAVGNAGMKYSGISNGMNMIQYFDSTLECLSKKFGYDSFICASQPNKSGSWTCEICDVRNFDKVNDNWKPFDQKNDCRMNLNNVAQGVCGETVATSTSTKPKKIAKYTGPLVYKKRGNNYIQTNYPDWYIDVKNVCDCKNINTSLCVSCTGFYSDTFCNSPGNTKK